MANGDYFLDWSCNPLSAPPPKPLSIPTSSVSPAFDDLGPFDTTDVIIAMKEISNKSQMICDVINGQTLKELGPSGVRMLVDIVNQIATSNVYSDSWKQAHITPNHKKGDLSSFRNYRPIGNLSPISKLADQRVFQKFDDHLYKTIHPSQFGGRPDAGAMNLVTNLYLETVECIDAFG